MNSVIVSVIICFVMVQTIEMMSFLSRVAGIHENRPAVAYAMQNAVFMFTRFFSMALLPMLGFLVDVGAEYKIYLTMCVVALVLSGIMSAGVLLSRSKIIGAFSAIIEARVSGIKLLRSIALLPLYVPRASPIETTMPLWSTVIRERLFYSAVFVFCVYALSIFLSFFVSLQVPAYRATLSQLSGITNAFATVLLTFWIEPKISRVIDENRVNAPMLVLTVLIGRVVGVGLLAPVIVCAILLGYAV